MHILIVEDEPAHAEAIRRAFQSAASEVKVQGVGTLIEYQEVISRTTPDIAIMDWKLPNGSGLDVLTSPPEDGPFPILIMTSYGNEEIAVEAMKAGALDYIVKSPETFAAMPRTVERALREWRLLQDRKQSDEALRLMLERYRELIENANEAIVVVQDGGLKFVNPMACEISGYSEEELLAVPFADLVHPDDRERVVAAHLQRLKGEKPSLRYAFRVAAKGGNFRWAEIGGALIEWDGKPATLNLLTDITARKQAEEALLESEAKIRSIFRAAPVGIGVESGRVILEANDTFCRMTGYPRDELIGQEARLLYPTTEGYEYVGREKYRQIDEKESGTVETRLRRKDGKIIHVLLSASPIDEKDLIKGVTFTALDITERKRAEEVQRLSLRFLEIVHNNPEMPSLLAAFVSEIKSVSGCAAVGIRILDEKGNIPYQNYEGFSRSFFEMESPLSIKSDKCMCINVIKGDVDPNLPFYTRGGSFYMNGTTRFLATVSEEEKGQTRNICNEVGYESVALAPIRVKNQTIGLIHMADPRENMVPLNIVEILENAGMQLGTAILRRQAEEALRESEEKYRTLFEDAIEGIFRTSPEGRFLIANPALARIYGFSSPEEMIGSIDDMAGQVYADPEERRAFTRAMEENEEVKGYELRLKRKDGSGLWVSINARAVRDGTGKVLYYEGQSEDITPRKLSEEKLRETLESLRKAVGTTIQVMVSAVETRDPYTAGHQKRVTDLARALAQELGLAQETIEGIRMAGSIHDLGKISVPAEILSKPTKLSKIEFALIKAHSQYGYEILKNVESPWPLADIVLQHHERMDGSGYPQGLKGEAILPEARILAVADVVESIVSHRPYRPGHGLVAALDEIEQNAGVLYDRRVVEACLRLFREKGFRFE